MFDLDSYLDLAQDLDRNPEPALDLDMLNSEVDIYMATSHNRYPDPKPDLESDMNPVHGLDTDPGSSLDIE